jgi:hypothetical protein
LLTISEIASGENHFCKRYACAIPLGETSHVPQDRFRRLGRVCGQQYVLDRKPSLLLDVRHDSPPQQVFNKSVRAVAAWATDSDGPFLSELQVGSEIKPSFAE